MFAAAKAPLEGEMLKKSLDDWLEGRKKTMKIEILRRDLREAQAAE
jgi:hypothetical protein